MTDKKPTPEQLGAYVDGELDAKEAAIVARAIASDKHIADQIACLTRLKATIPQIVPDTPIGLTAKPPAPRLRYAIAAAFMAFAIITGITAVSFLNREQPTSAWLTAAHQQHEAWISKTAGAGFKLPDSPAFVAVASRSYGSDVVFPDLSSAKLSLVAANVLHHKNTRTLHLGYIGTRGCRVSLFVLGKPIKTSRGVLQDSTRIATWHQGENGYILMSSGMDPAHFETLAKMLGKLKGLKQPFQKPERQMLAASRKRAKPCQA